MPPSLDTTTRNPPKDKHSRLKRDIRYLLHVFHLIIAILMLCIVILNLISHLRTPFILYLLPLIIYVIIIEICYLFHRSPPTKLTNGIYGHQSLRRRAFNYQIAGVLGIGFATRSWRDGVGDAVLGISITVLVVGILLFLVAHVAHECGYGDWVEPEPGGSIRIHDTESAEEIDPILVSPA